MVHDQPPTIVIDGREASLGLDVQEPLVRAVINSLFTWRRAEADDELPADSREGWWGDSFPVEPGDRIGSRLWLLSRAKMTADTLVRARGYAEEALSWLIEDGVAARVEVEVERHGLDTLALACRIYRHDGSRAADIRFDDVWSFIR